MAKQTECALCNGAWEWECEVVHDFNIPSAKRVWPAVCLQCRTRLEDEYKSGKMSRTEFAMEISTISARAAKKCARNPGDVARLLEQMNRFTPTRRGKR